jgi:putative tryptophan/tyrosine transport system substrate-binding protein
MRRREFITLIGGAVTSPLAARAQQAATPVIGWLSSRTSAADALVLPAFRRGLSAHGYVEGQNVTVEYRWADGQLQQLPALAAGLVRRPVALVVALGDGVIGTRATRAASTAIPIIFITGNDPVEEGLVPNLHRPGGNVTGVTAFFKELTPKKVGLLHELLPRASTIGVLADPTQGTLGAEREMTALEAAGQALGKRIMTVNVAADRNLDTAFEKLTQIKADALFVTVSPIFFSRIEQIVALAARHAVPTLYFRREFAAKGGLMSYGSSAEDNYRVLGDYAGRILNGAKAGDLPVQQPTKFELVINLKTAKTLGLEFPPTLLAAADEVIE